MTYKKHSELTGSDLHGSSNVLDNANYAIEGYSTGRNVLRSILLRIQPGSTPGMHINVSNITSTTLGFNAPTITNGVDIDKLYEHLCFLLLQNDYLLFHILYIYTRIKA